VVIEATANATAVANPLVPYVGHVIIANPKQWRMIGYSKIKTDAIDAAILAKLYASGFVPGFEHQNIVALRRQVARRVQLVRQRARLKN
jgi:transposase